MIPLLETSIFRVSTFYKESKFPIEFDDGSLAFMKHKRIDVIFIHKTSGDKIQFGFTAKSKYYRKAMLEIKESSIEFREFMDELTRLTDKVTAQKIYGQAEYRLITGV